jgi:hypothetical protein
LLLGLFGAIKERKGLHDSLCGCERSELKKRP